MIATRHREREFFATSPEYGHLASRMGSEYLAKLLSKHLESVIKARIPSLVSLINKTTDELKSDLTHFGRPVSIDEGAQLYTILELCRAFDRVFKEHLEGGGRSDLCKSVCQADGYQPHLIAPEQGYRRLIESSLSYFRGPAEASVDAIHFILKELVRKSIRETQALRRFPTLQAEIVAAANEALERFRDDSKKTVLRMVDMEASYLTGFL
ncbi:unnamed protein product [Coffea canephora]|uniref:Dynamin stalk domain-containing protein n=1 Tax=Coffea canephora TaxID=49390 RepID=A0A068V1R6_COFCA|nr:unnamed protein product [Coffea canephora]